MTVGQPHLIVAPKLRVEELTPPAVNSVSQSVAVLRPGCRTLLPVVDRVLLCDTDEAPPVQGRIDFARLVEALEGSVTWVDDDHVVVESVGGTEWAALVHAATVPGTFGPAASAAVTERSPGAWVWVVDRDGRYLAFEFDDPSRGRTARGRAVSEPPTATEVQAAVEQPDHTFLTGAGVGEVRRLAAEEIRMLGLPPAPPWA